MSQAPQRADRGPRPSGSGTTDRSAPRVEPDTSLVRLRLSTHSGQQLPGRGLADQPKLAVIIPARDEARRIGPCLRRISVALEIAGLSSCEVLVVDDQSSDDTAAAAARLGVPVVSQPRHQGRMAAWLRGVAATTAPVLIFVDADCQVGVDSFRELLQAMEDPRVGVAAGRSLPHPTGAEPVAIRRSARFASRLLHEVKAQLDNHDFLPIGRLMAVRRSAWTATDGSLAPCDRVVAHLAREANWRVVYVPSARVFYEPVQSFAELLEDYLRTGVVNAPLPLGRDPLPIGVKLRAAVRAMLRAPLDGLAWGGCRAVLVAHRLRWGARLHLQGGRP